ncbi:MAG TPA: TRAP transporter substrate-binding protein [Methylomirabilota bacterium]|nr:TRAP transporter substrate-binding protein [Methylomirabilota bacterium]
MTRRDFGSAVLGAGLAAWPARAAAQAPPRWRARQFHNQPAESHQHRFLVDLWNAVRSQTGGRLEVTVHPQNDGIQGSDPAALEMLRAGDLEFFTLMGGILGRAVPAAEIQGLPFAFRTHEQVHRVNDGPLGVYLGKECAAKGIHRFQYGLLENGFRQIGMVDRPIRTADDLAGVRMRVPDGEMFRDLFSALGAQPITLNIRELYDALQTRRVDGQENPLVITEVNRLYEVTRYVSLTSHMWSGFNLLGNAGFWNGLPADVREIVDRNVRRVVAAQRAYTNTLNESLENTLRGRGLVFNAADTGSFRRTLGGVFYQKWKAQLGTTAWSLLEAEIGSLG